MATLTTQQEYDAIRAAIQAFATGTSIYSFSLGDTQITYHSTQKEWLQEREQVLAARLSSRNVRKRMVPDFTG